MDMSFKRLLSKKLKLKAGLTRNLSKRSFNADASDNHFVNKKKSNLTWTVLITGGAGHLAEHLVAKLIEQIKEDIRPHVMTDLENEEIEEVGGVEKNSGKRFQKKQKLLKIEQEIELRLGLYIQIVLVDLIAPKEEILNDYTTFIEGSFDDGEVMRTALENVDTVYHLAAVGMTGHYARDRQACMDINAIGTTNLMSWAKQAGVQRFIYASSIGAIFNGQPLHNVKESLEYPADYYNFYCESKAQAERIVREASCGEMKTTVLRFNGIYGPGEKRVTERVVKFMLSGWWIGICKPDGVEAMTQLSCVENCVQGLIKAEIALRPADANHAQVYNIMDENQAGTFSFWTPLKEALGCSNEMYNIPPLVLRVFGALAQFYADYLNLDPIVSKLEIDLLIVESTFSLNKARRELGYEPKSDQMAEVCEYYQNEIKAGRFKRNRSWILFFQMTGAALVLIIIIFLLLSIAFHFILSILTVFKNLFFN